MGDEERFNNLYDDKMLLYKLGKLTNKQLRLLLTRFISFCKNTHSSLESERYPLCKVINM